MPIYNSGLAYAANNAVATFSAATPVAVANSLTAVSLLAANSSRRFLMLTNTSLTATVYIRLAAVATPATTALFDICLPPGAVYESDVPVWVGALNAIATAANGSILVSEGT